jgi:hypothetical protein
MPQTADAIRTVTAKLQAAIEDGYRSRMIDADDLVEILLAVADELDRTAAESELLAAARALLEAREDQMLTSVEWDRLRHAVESSG